MFLRRVHRRLACRLALHTDRALALLACGTPVSTIAYSDEAPRERLVVFLPGIGDFAEDFERHGFIGALMASGLDADALAVDAHYGYYGRRTVLERLADDVVLPARSRGYDEVWLVGISMGGFGALSYVAQHPGHIARALLLAPYLGEQEWIEAPTNAAVSAAGNDTRSHVQRLWQWIRVHGNERGVQPKLYLGYGERDRFARANALFARHLPAEQVRTSAGGHDWRTWRRLWDIFLAAWRGEAAG